MSSERNTQASSGSSAGSGSGKIVPIVVGAAVVGGAAAVAAFIFSRFSSSETSSLREKIVEQERALVEMRQRLADAERKEAEESKAGEGVPRAVPRSKPVRVYMDGCFDLMHFGHSNALRQTKALGDVLVVGIHSDTEIMANKGPPVMNYEERLSMLKSMKWVDEIILDAPYSPTEEWMNLLFTKYDIDFLVHGDDPTYNSAGEDAYAAPKKAGKMKIIKRTEGVSTTDIVGRMLLMSRNHHILNTDAPVEGRIRSLSEDFSEGGERKTIVSQFLPTTRRLLQFSKGIAPKPTDRIVLISGAFDLFHVGHADALAKAREYGDFLLVGIHDDQTVNRRRGGILPIMNVHERALSVLACKHVDEVIIGCPWAITRDMIVTMNISVVVAGTECETRHFELDPADIADEYRVPKEMGIFQQFESVRALSACEVMERVMHNRERYEEKFRRKNKSERTYLANKEYIEEQ